MALPAGAASLDEANAAIELWEFYKGRKLDAGQRLDVSIMLATRDDGLWASSVTGHEKPRQSGKGDAIEVVELWGLTQRAERILHTIHDAVLLATETHSRMLSLLEGHADLRRLKARDWKGTGQQMIEMRNGGIVWYRTRTGSGGRGVDEVDRLIVDEAQHAEQQHLASVTPTQAVAANPQLNALGTGGLPGKSAWWWSLRIQAKTGSADALAWAGWSAQPWSVDTEGRVTLDKVDPFDRSLWWSTIPGLVAGRTTIEFLERELSVLGPAGFAQEYLCEWAPPPDGASSRAISPDAWAALSDLDSLPTDGTRRVCLSAPAHLTNAWFVEAGRRDDGKLHVGVRREVPTEDMGRLVELAKAIADGHGVSIIIPPGDPILAYRAELVEAGVDLDEMKPAEFAQGCGYIKRKVEAGEMRQRRHEALDAAVRGLTTKRAGQVEVWDPRASEVDLSPLVAATCALVRVPEKVEVGVAEAHVVFA